MLSRVPKYKDLPLLALWEHMLLYKTLWLVVSVGTPAGRSGKPLDTLSTKCIGIWNIMDKRCMVGLWVSWFSICRPRRTETLMTEPIYFIKWDSNYLNEVRVLFLFCFTFNIMTNLVITRLSWLPGGCDYWTFTKSKFWSNPFYFWKTRASPKKKLVQELQL